MGLNHRAPAGALVAILALVLLSTFQCEAAPKPPSGEVHIMEVTSSNADFNDALQVYESVPELAVRLDFSVQTGWYNGSITMVRFIATMAPAIETKTDVRTYDNTFDPHLAGLKYIADSKLVANSYKVDISEISAGELSGRERISVTFTFRTAGIWRVFYVYDISGVGYCGPAGEAAMVKVTGHPGDVGSFSAWMSGVLAVPVVVQFAYSWGRKLLRGRDRR